MPTGDIPFAAPAPRRGGSGFEPSAALAILDGLAGGGPGSDAASAWDAAWIACLIGSPRWAETARLECAHATARPVVHSPGGCPAVAGISGLEEKDLIDSESWGWATSN